MTTKKQRATKPGSVDASATGETGSDAPQESVSFESAIQRLGVIVAELEAGDMPLEESLALFEEGIKLARASQARLETAEKRIEKLLSIDESGSPVIAEIGLPETP